MSAAEESQPDSRRDQRRRVEREMVPRRGLQERAFARACVSTLMDAETPDADDMACLLYSWFLHPDEDDENALVSEFSTTFDAERLDVICFQSLLRVASSARSLFLCRLVERWMESARRCLAYDESSERDAERTEEEEARNDVLIAYAHLLRLVFRTDAWKNAETVDWNEWSDLVCSLVERCVRVDSDDRDKPRYRIQEMNVLLVLLRLLYYIVRCRLPVSMSDVNVGSFLLRICRYMLECITLDSRWTITEANRMIHVVSDLLISALSTKIVYAMDVLELLLELDVFRIVFSCWNLEDYYPREMQQSLSRIRSLPEKIQDEQIDVSTLEEECQRIESSSSVLSETESGGLNEARIARKIDEYVAMSSMIELLSVLCGEEDCRSLWSSERVRETFEYVFLLLLSLNYEAGLPLWIQKKKVSESSDSQSFPQFRNAYEEAFFSNPSPWSRRTLWCFVRALENVLRLVKEDSESCGLLDRLIVMTVAKVTVDRCIDRSFADGLCIACERVLMTDEFRTMFLAARLAVPSCWDDQEIVEPGVKANIVKKELERKRGDKKDRVEASTFSEAADVSFSDIDLLALDQTEVAERERLLTTASMEQACIRVSRRVDASCKLESSSMLSLLKQGDIV